jgi:hypothetical protein
LEDDVSFMELATRLGAYTPVLSALEHSYRASEAHEASDPHGYEWHTSIHVSSMWNPCKRYHVLNLMGMPEIGDPIEPEGRAIMDAGKDAEVQKVKRLELAGYLVSSADSFNQTGFSFPYAWLTGNTDAALLLPGWDRPHILELKGKDNERDGFKKLADGSAQPEAEYIAQLQGYINLANLLGPVIWPHLKPCESGSLVFFNRARPFQTLEFFYEIDRDWFNERTQLLHEARLAFEEGRLPDHIGDGKGWSESPCDWCELKKHYCKPAWKAGYDELDQVAKMVTETVDAEYDYQEKRAAVLLRWAS